MQQTVNEVYRPLFTTRKRYIILMGGRGAGRSTVASQFLLSHLVSPVYMRAAIMRFLLNDVRSSSFREIKDRIDEQGILIKPNETMMSFEYGRNSINAHGFRKSQGDNTAKLKSLANYNKVWIEEADEAPEDDFTQLDDSLRTTKGDIQLLLTLNPPPKNHWIIKRWFRLEPSEMDGFYIPICVHPDVEFVWTDWRVNARNIDQATQRRYEEYRTTKPDHYWNMIRGYVPEVLKGKIYKDWRIVEDVPHNARLLGYGLDFGFDPDPAAIVAIYYYEGGYILDEITYQTELENRHLASILNNKKKAPVVADSAEPKSINEMRTEGVDVFGCEKGGDSVRYGIKHVQSLRISYTRRSVNIHKEYENYAWKINKDGDEVGIEDPKCANHAMSAVRYGLVTFVEPRNEEKQISLPPQPDSKYDGILPLVSPVAPKPRINPDGSMTFV